MFEEILSPELKEELISMGMGSGEPLHRFWKFMRGDRSSQHLEQKKVKFFYPDLTNTGWFEHERFPAIQRAAALLEAGHAVIREEFDAYVNGSDGALVPYRAFRVAQGAAARRSSSGPPPEWKALYFYQDGKPNPTILERFPRTTALVEEALGAIRYPMGEVHYSILEPGGHIKPHCDLMNFTSSFHLGVTIPRDCALRVDGEDRTWTDGKCFLFDHSFTHEAWNRSDQRRVTLIADVWNPALSDLEKQAVLKVFRWLYEQTHGA